MDSSFTHPHDLPNTQDFKELNSHWSCFHCMEELCEYSSFVFPERKK